mmetsp:Transcript_54955/g.129047  ORF Transcript_54955/g.129047 Transcript_54955/m.129047 type:complete len:214 (+) Transcript_54955:787-1428(+)
MAPKAPRGATFMTMPMILKKQCPNSSMLVSTVFDFSPANRRAKPKSMDTKRTCRMSPFAKGLATVSGMMCMMKRIGLSLSALLTYFSIAEASGWASKFFPGWTMLPTSRPSARAKVEIVSKYSNAFTATPPTFDALPTWQIPGTMVQKMMGAMTILISFTKPVPSWDIHGCDATSGHRPPTAAASTMASSTWAYSGKRGHWQRMAAKTAQSKI